MTILQPYAPYIQWNTKIVDVAMRHLLANFKIWMLAPNDDVIRQVGKHDILSTYSMYGHDDVCMYVCVMI